jgi:hypothetical protein
MHRFQPSESNFIRLCEQILHSGLKFLSLLVLPTLVIAVQTAAFANPSQQGMDPAGAVSRDMNSGNHGVTADARQNETRPQGAQPGGDQGDNGRMGSISQQNQAQEKQLQSKKVEPQAQCNSKAQGNFQDHSALNGDGYAGNVEALEARKEEMHDIQGAPNTVASIKEGAGRTSGSGSDFYAGGTLGGSAPPIVSTSGDQCVCPNCITGQSFCGDANHQCGGGTMPCTHPKCLGWRLNQCHCRKKNNNNGGGGGNNNNNNNSGGGGDNNAGAGNGPGEAGGHATNEGGAASPMIAALQAAQIATEAEGKMQQSMASGSMNQGSRASSAGEDSVECMHAGFDNFMESLINAANEDAGAPCSSRQATKTYANVTWMVQQMYKQCYIPMAILFLLPGALATNAKTLVSYGILGSMKDEDAMSPFTGILRSVIAIFLIPATQLTMSYIVDIGNSLEASCRPYISLPLIYMWAEEQVQTFSPDQQGKAIKNLPLVPQAPYRGKFAGMPAKGAVLEQLAGMDDALSELANETFHMMTIGMNVVTAFQMVVLWYLFALGPLAAAFFAWPSVGRDLFRKAFASWVDGVVILCLWRFWWNVVLICMTTRLMTEAVNPYDPWEVYYLVAFMAVMLTIPFNPFDFRAGELVTHILGKAESVAGKVAQGGKGGGSGGKGKAHKAG